jgi:alpha-amylase/alpha-mannosidase (GH57 family)
MQQINFRVADREKEHLERYCELTERTISDVLRQYIRSLSVEGVLNPLDRPAIPLDTDSTSSV